MKSTGGFILGNLISFVLTLSYIHGQADDGVPVEVTAIEGKSITLRCTSASARTSAPKHVEWVDMVYNSEPEEPKKIFTTRHNPEKLIDPNHPNAQNYRVDSDFSLTISHVNLANDPGQYTCKSVWEDGEKKSNHYSLSIASMPTCSGETNVVERHGQSTKLECQMLFSGNSVVTLQWYHGDELLQSEDDFDVRKAVKRLTVRNSHQHDKAKYTCRISFGDMTESCSLKMNVSYLVRDVKISPDKEKIRAGDEIKCAAKGNPVPEVTISTVGGAKETGHESRSLRVDEKFVGQEIEVRCSASNRVADKTETLTASKVFRVAEKSRNSNKHVNDGLEMGDEAKHAESRPVQGSDKSNSAQFTTSCGILTVVMLLLVNSLSNVRSI